MVDELAGHGGWKPAPSLTLGFTSRSVAGETAGPGRSLFDDIDDYNGLVVQPPADRWGIPLGTDDGDGTIRQSTLQLANGYLAQYRVQVTVYYVQNTALATPLPYGVTTNYRGAQVQVSYNDPHAGLQQLVTLTRVLKGVPSPWTPRFCLVCNRRGGMTMVELLDGSLPPMGILAGRDVRGIAM